MESNYAGPLRRAGAVFIDAIIVIGFLNIFILHPNTFPGLIDTRLLMVFGVSVVYEALLIYYLGATIGKLIMGIRVVDYSTYARPSLLQCFIRPWARVFFGLGIIGNVLIGFMSLIYSVLNLFKMVADEEHLAIHDKIAKTVALRSH